MSFLPLTSSRDSVALLINFSAQISAGMEALAAKRIVHKDLRLMNCFVCDGFIVKVSIYIYMCVCVRIVCFLGSSKAVVN